jgi:hypothetical protein
VLYPGGCLHERCTLVALVTNFGHFDGGMTCDEMIPRTKNRTVWAISHVLVVDLVILHG